MHEPDEPTEHPSEYAWEQNFERTWEKVTVAPDGTLRTGVNRTWRAERPEVQENVKRGVLRTLFLVLDCSHHVLDSDLDMKPSRLAVMQDVCAEFITKFFEQNPISSLALLITKEGKAEMLTEPSCNARQHLQALQRLGDCKGDASLQNVLELARQALESVASFVSREVLLLSASLSTTDPGDIFETIAHLKRQRVRCSVCSLLAEVYVLPHAESDVLAGGRHSALPWPPTAGSPSSWLRYAIETSHWSRSGPNGKLWHSHGPWPISPSLRCAPHRCSSGPHPHPNLPHSGAQAACIGDEWRLRRGGEPAAPAPVRAAARDAAPLRAGRTRAARQRALQQPHPHRLPRAAPPRRRADALLRPGERRADAAGRGALLVPAVQRGPRRDPHRLSHLQPAPHVVCRPHQDVPPPLPSARLRGGPRHQLGLEPSP